MHKIKFNIGEFYYRMQNGGDCTDEEARIVFEKYPRAMQLLDARYFTEEFIGDVTVENILENVPVSCFEKIFPIFLLYIKSPNINVTYVQ